MPDYKILREICLNSGRVSGKVVDQWLIYYAAAQNRLDREFEDRLGPYKHIVRKFDRGWVGLLKSQYIAHRAFRKDGLIKKYLRHSAVKTLDDAAVQYLGLQAITPWRFSFSCITSRPEKEFFIMQDVFTDDSFLLYSPGMEKTLREQSVLLWFNLVGFNGICWQTFGPIAPYRSFTSDDIFFFATEMNAGIGSEDDITADVEANPVPYMMLLCGANYPLTRHHKDLMIHNRYDYEPDQFDAEGLDKDFFVERNGNIWRLQLKRWKDPPHFSTAYYHAGENLLTLSAMTDRGFSELVNRLNKYGYAIRDFPDIHVTPSMITTAEEILKKKIPLDEYAALFDEPPSEEKAESLDRLNDFLQLILPDINAGRKPDIAAMARRAGCDAEAAARLVEKIMPRIDKLKR